MVNGNLEQNQNIYSTPPSTTPPPPSYFEGTLPPKPKSKKIRIIIGVIIGILLVSTAGATVALYTRIFDPLWNPFRPEPDKVIQEMTQRMKQVKTIHSATEINIEAKEEDGVANISLILNSDADTTDSKNTKSTGNFDIAFDLKPTGKYTTSSGEIKVSFGGEAKTIGQISYFKINTIPSMIADSLRSETGIDLNGMLRDKWIKIDPESISKSLKEFMENYLGASMVPEIEGMLEKQFESQKGLQEKFKKMTEGKKFFLVKKELSDSEINGIKSYHYIMSLDKGVVKSLIPEFAILYIDMIKEIMPPDYPLTDEDIYEAKKQITQELNKSFDEFFAKVGDIDGEVWIGKKDCLLYKVKMEKVIDLSKLNENKEYRPNEKMTFKVDMNFSNFDKPVIVEAPKEFTDIMDILMPIIQTFLEQAQKRAEDAAIKSNLSGARAIAEMINADFDSYENLCAEPPAKKLNRNAPNDGSYLATIEDNIKKRQGGVLDLVCLDSATSYCITAGLVSEGKYCVDSSGITGDISEDLACQGTGTLQSPYKCPWIPLEQ